MYLVYLKYWTLNFTPLMVYPEVLFIPIFSIKVLQVVDKIGAVVTLGGEPCHLMLLMVYPKVLFHANLSIKVLQVVDKIGAVVTLEGEPRQLLQELRRPDLGLTANPSDRCSAALTEMEALFKLLEAMQVLQHFAFVPSLPGGFEYYTGLVFEAHAAAIQAPIAVGGRWALPLQLQAYLDLGPDAKVRMYLVYLKY